MISNSQIELHTSLESYDRRVSKVQCSLKLQKLLSSVSDRRDSRNQETVLFLNASADPNEKVVEKKSSKPT